MTPSPDGAQKIHLAFFSHSYHASEREINLFFWELLRKHDLLGSVIAPESKEEPLDITYLEWLMRRCDCFVAVIPRREDTPPYNCSPFQMFENGLALRSRKPRLIFVEEGLNEVLFGGEPDEIFSFSRGKGLFDQDKDIFVEAARRLSQRVHASAAAERNLVKPAAMLVKQIGPYDSLLIRKISQVARNNGFAFQHINPTDFDQDDLFVREMQQLSLVLSEVRLPYIAPDVFAIAHFLCIPTIRICHLEERESVERASAELHLSHDSSKWADSNHMGLPLILSKYQITQNMEPVIFWKKPNELAEKISARLQRINEKRVDLFTAQEARSYFLDEGQKSESV